MPQCKFSLSEHRLLPLLFICALTAWGGHYTTIKLLITQKRTGRREARNLRTAGLAVGSVRMTVGVYYAGRLTRKSIL